MKRELIDGIETLYELFKVNGYDVSAILQQHHEVLVIRVKLKPDDLEQLTKAWDKFRGIEGG